MKKGHSRLRLKEIVGDQVYAVWTDMLGRLVPQGRTHRLAPMIAAMLHYALAIAAEKDDNGNEEGSVTQRLISAYDNGYGEETEGRLLPLIQNLFRDAGVEYERISKAGEHYSIAEEAVNEFVSWYEYPWDS
jgi:hypothetical protein